MKTVIDFVDAIYTAINVPNIRALITGMYKHKRLDNTRAVDIVIVPLVTTGDSLQDATINVNIHAPNLKLNINGQADNSQPDAAKIKLISDAVIEQLTGYEFDDFDLVVQNITMFPEDQLFETFMNIRVQIYSPDIKIYS